MKIVYGLAALAAATVSTAAWAAPERIRGTVSSVSSDQVVVHTADKDVTVTLMPQTRFVKVIKASLDQVDKDAYIGTATKEVGGKMIALEVLVFPPAMKGAGEGSYGWDRIRDTTVGGTGTTSSTMTNGTVSNAQTSAATTNSTMTNGTVSGASAAGGTKQITVDYKGGQKTIIVPPTAPIVTFQPDTVSDLTQGKTVFVVANEQDGKLQAASVAIGSDGAPPPM